MSEIFIEVLIPDIRFQSSFRLMVSSLIGMPVIVVLPSSLNLNQSPSPLVTIVARLYQPLKEYNVPSIDSGNRIVYEASSTSRGKPTRFQPER